MKYGWLLLVFLAGLVVPLQAAMNARMKHFVGSPMYSSAVNFVVGAIAILLVSFAASSLGAEGNWKGASDAPWWAWCGGIAGILFITIAVLAIPKTGAAGFSAMVVAGQLIGSLLIDHYGWLELPKRQVSGQSLAGTAVLMVGVWLIQRG